MKMSSLILVIQPTCNALCIFIGHVIYLVCSLHLPWSCYLPSMLSASSSVILSSWNAIYILAYTHLLQIFQNWPNYVTTFNSYDATYTVWIIATTSHWMFIPPSFANRGLRASALEPPWSTIAHSAAPWTYWSCACLLTTSHRAFS